MSGNRARLLALSTLALLIVPALAACGSTSGGGATTTAKKICLVTDIGGLNDRGFNALANQGLEQAKKDLGVTGVVTESKSGDDYVPNLTNCATTQNADLTIGVGFLMQEAIGTVATQFPNKKFAIVDGTGTDKDGKDLNQTNVTGLFFKEQDAGALVGVIEAVVTAVARFRTDDDDASSSRMLQVGQIDDTAWRSRSISFDVTMINGPYEQCPLSQKTESSISSGPYVVQLGGSAGTIGSLPLSPCSPSAMTNPCAMSA